MIHISEKKLVAALEITLAGEEIYSDDLLNKISYDISALSEKINQPKKTEKELPCLNDEVWELADEYKQKGVIEKRTESDAVLVYYKDVWQPGKLCLIKRYGEDKTEYMWSIPCIGDWLLRLEYIKFWQEMLPTPK